MRFSHYSHWTGIYRPLYARLSSPDCLLERNEITIVHGLLNKSRDITQTLQKEDSLSAHALMLEPYTHCWCTDRRYYNWNEHTEIICFHQNYAEEYIQLI